MEPDEWARRMRQRYHVRSWGCEFEGPTPECVALEGREDECQFRGPYFELHSWPSVVFLSVGVPCLVLLGASLVFLVTLRQAGGAHLGPRATGGTGAAYGLLLDVNEIDVELDERRRVENHVNAWVKRGAAAAAAYGGGFLLLGLMAGIHMVDMTAGNGSLSTGYSYMGDVALSLVLCACKLVVAVCARVVHQRLSPMARRTAGRWTCGLWVSKALMAVTSLGLCFVYAELERIYAGPTHSDRADAESASPDYVALTTPALRHNHAVLCDAAAATTVSLTAALPFQTGAGLCLLAIQRLAQAEAARSGYPGAATFSAVVGPWWLGLVCGTVAVGICLWLGGAGFVFGLEGFETLHIYYALAGSAQVLAGLSMLGANRHIRAYFEDPTAMRWAVPASPVGKSLAVELCSCGAQMDQGYSQCARCARDVSSGPVKLPPAASLNG